MRKCDIREYKRVINRRNVRKGLGKLIDNSEKFLYHGKKWIIVVFIPTLQIMANILALLNEEEEINEYDDQWRY